MPRRDAVALISALLVLAAACEEQVAAGPREERPDGDPVCETGDCTGSGGKGGSGGEGGSVAAGGTGGVVEPAGEVLGTCDPTQAVPLCFMAGSTRLDLYHCVERDGRWLMEGIECPEGESCDGRDSCMKARVLEDVCREGSCPEPGQTACVFNFDHVASCQLVEPGFDTLLCPAPFYDWSADHPCENDQVCVDGACVDSCNTELCDCPIDYEPACGDDGRTYWNPCYRACGGVAEGAGCLLDELVGVARLPEGTSGLAGLEPGLIWTASYFDYEVSHEPSHVEHCLRRIDLGDAQREPTVEEVDCQTLPIERVSPTESHMRGSVHQLAALKTEEGWWTIGQGIRSELGFTDGTRVPEEQVLPVDSAGRGFALGKLGGTKDFLMMSLFLVSLHADRTGPAQLHVEASFPFDLLGISDGDGPAQFISFGRFGASEPDVYALSTANQVDVFALEDGPPARRRHLGMTGIHEAGTVTSEVWNTGSLAGLFSVSSMMTMAGGRNAYFADDVWDGSCFERHGLGMFETPDSRGAGDLIRGDVDGDGAAEMIWPAGGKIFVLGRAPNGMLFIRAELPVDEWIGFAEPVPVDLDGDGRAELVVTQYGRPDEDRVNGFGRHHAPWVYRINLRAPTLNVTPP